MLLTIVVVVMICSISYSQNSRIVVIGKDTFSLVPMRMVNEIVDSKIALMECDSLMKEGKVILQEESNKNDILIHKVNNQSEIINNDSIIQRSLKADNTMLLNTVDDNKKKVIRLKKGLIISGIINGITTLGLLVSVLFCIK